MGALERARVARRRRLGGGRARQPAGRVPVERRARPDWRSRPTSPRTPRSWASRCSCSRRSPGPRSCSRRRRRPTSVDSPACTRRPATRASPDGPRRPAGTRTGRPSWRPTTATTRASRATRRSSRRSVRCTAATSTATSSSPARWRARYGSERGYGLAVLRRRSPVGGRIEEALALTEESVAAARDARQPVLDLVRALDRGDGVLEGRRAPRVRRVGRGRRRSCASTASSSSRASSRATRLGCTRPTASPRPRWCCSPRPSPRSSAPATCRS